MVLLSDVGKSVYNEGYFQIQRLNNLWLAANTYCSGGDLVNWRHTLDVIWRELSRDLFKDVPFKSEVPVWYEDNEYYKSFKMFQKDLANCESDSGVFYAVLCSYEVFLRYVQDKVGKGGKYVDEDDNRMD